MFGQPGPAGDDLRRIPLATGIEPSCRAAVVVDWTRSPKRTRSEPAQHAVLRPEAVVEHALPVRWARIRPRYWPRPRARRRRVSAQASRALRPCWRTAAYWRRARPAPPAARRCPPRRSARRSGAGQADLHRIHRRRMPGPLTRRPCTATLRQRLPTRPPPPGPAGLAADRAERRRLASVSGHACKRACHAHDVADRCRSPPAGDAGRARRRPPARRHSAVAPARIGSFD